MASWPPGKETIVNYVLQEIDGSGTHYLELNKDDIYIECPSKECDGLRYFERLNVQGAGGMPKAGTLHYAYLWYVCRNCRKNLKVIAIKFTSPQLGSLYCNVLKLAEDPPFGPRVPARVITLIGPDRDLFLKGRRCENQGLGIGAFAYYRRVIENQKNRLLDEIIKAATRLNAPTDQIQALEAAKAETQFSRTIESVKAAIPAELLIQGRNPLSLLHSALSEGLHALTDEQCLELATSIREVLFELAERIGQVLKEQAGLDAAVARVLKGSES